MALTKEDIIKTTNESVSMAIKALEKCTGKQVDSKAVTTLAVQTFYISTVSRNAEQLTYDAVKLSHDSLSQHFGKDTQVEAVAELAKQVLYYLYESEKNFTND